MIPVVSMTQEELDALPTYLDVVLQKKNVEQAKFRGIWQGPQGIEFAWYLVYVHEDGKLGKNMQRIEVSSCASTAR